MATSYNLNTQPNAVGGSSNPPALGWYGPQNNGNSAAPTGAGVGGPMFGMFPQNNPTFRQNQLNSASLGGQVAGTYANSALNSIPSLAGLFSGGSTGSTGTGGFTPITGLPSLQGLSAGGGGGAVGGGVSGGGAGSSGSVPQIQIPDQTQAIASRFAAAKDTVGKNSRAAIDSLRSELGATGNLGGGSEATGVQNVINTGQGQLGDVARAEAENQADLGTKIAEENAQLGTTERGQDISQATTERGQTLGAQESVMNAQVAQQEAAARLALENRQQLFSLLGLVAGGKGGSTASGTSLY